MDSQEKKHFEEHIEAGAADIIVCTELDAETVEMGINDEHGDLVHLSLTTKQAKTLAAALTVASQRVAR